jgi:hypothetical protein
VFRIIGGGSGNAAFASGPCATIYSDGVSLGQFQVGVFDLDGVDGLSASDLSRWLADFFTCAVPPTYCARGDYNFVQGQCGVPELTAGDLAVWFDAFFVPGGTYATPLCP